MNFEILLLLRQYVGNWMGDMLVIECEISSFFLEGIPWSFINHYAGKSAKTNWTTLDGTLSIQTKSWKESLALLAKASTNALPCL